jgi:cell division protein DivIC
MVKKRISKQSKRRLTILVPLFFIAIAFFILSFISSSINLYKLKIEEKKLVGTYNSLKKDEQSLKTEIEKLHDLDYVARYARENYLYSKDGEIVFKFNEEPKEKETVISEDNDIYYISGGVLLIVLLLVIVFKRKKRTKSK